MNKLVSEAKIDDWRQYIIQEPRLISYCRKMCIRFDYDGHGEIYLLNILRVSGYHVGLYSHFVYLKLKDINDIPELQPLKSAMKKYNGVAGDGYVPSLKF